MKFIIDNQIAGYWAENQLSPFKESIEDELYMSSGYCMSSKQSVLPVREYF